MVWLLPHVPAGWTIPVFVIYGFFFLSSYPMSEAALMEAVPDAVRGRVFGLFITVSGLIGNLSHWIVGVLVKGIGAAAYSPTDILGSTRSSHFCWAFRWQGCHACTRSKGAKNNLAWMCQPAWPGKFNR